MEWKGFPERERDTVDAWASRDAWINGYYSSFYPASLRQSARSTFQVTVLRGRVTISALLKMASRKSAPG